MQCSGCEQEYIGDTRDSLQHRMTEHRRQIRNANVRILHVSTHNASCPKDYDIMFKLFPLYKLKDDSTVLHKIKEANFIEILKPQLNRTF